MVDTTEYIRFNVVLEDNTHTNLTKRININTYYFVTGVWRRLHQYNSVELWLNGNLEKQLDITKNSYDTSGRPIRIGVRPHDLGSYINANIGHCMAFTKALPQDKIKQLSDVLLRFYS